MSAAVTERRLVDVLVRHMRTGGIVRREVRHYEKYIDIVVLRDQDSVETIEAKTSDWRRAMQQATVNLAIADYSYIAIWSENLHRVPIEELRKQGIGLFAVGAKWGAVELVLQAQPSPFVNALARDRMRARLARKIT